MSDVLVLKNVARKFGDAVALVDASLRVAAGELLALLGPNGAGKTTLIRAVSGRLKIDSGSITVCGTQQAAGGQTEISKSLGVIPQDIALYDTLNATENLDLFGRIYGVPESDLNERIEWALKWTGLEDRRSDLVTTYSGGMKRRLNIACGILHSPKVILLDEPTVGVDPQSRERIWEMLQLLKSDGIAIVLTTHQLDEAQQVSDRIVIIDRGKTIADGSFQQLLSQLPDRRTRICLAVSDIPSPLPKGCTVESERRLSVQVEEVGKDLAQILKDLSAAGITVDDISAVNPNLQSVFLHYTGRELRE
ncbi:MAG: ABC transporter ATP-binding protein [Fuerstiella sp.]